MASAHGDVVKNLILNLLRHAVEGYVPERHMPYLRVMDDDRNGVLVVEVRFARGPGYRYRVRVQEIHE